MKKLLFLFFTLPMFSQVGIGTTNPETTLHIANIDTLVYGLRIEKVPVMVSNDFLVIDSFGNVGRRTVNFPGHWKIYQEITDAITNLESDKTVYITITSDKIIVRKE